MSIIFPWLPNSVRKIARFHEFLPFFHLELLELLDFYSRLVFGVRGVLVEDVFGVVLELVKDILG